MNSSLDFEAIIDILSSSNPILVHTTEVSPDEYKDVEQRELKPKYGKCVKTMFWYIVEGDMYQFTYQRYTEKTSFDFTLYRVDYCHNYMGTYIFWRAGDLVKHPREKFLMNLIGLAEC